MDDIDRRIYGKGNLSYGDLKHLSKTEIKKKIREWDSRNWRKEVQERSSLKIYTEWKKEIRREEDIYDNRPVSVIIYKARTNNLNLNDRNRHKNEDTKCLMCEHRVEDLIHFILWCPGYQ